ncbi:MAG: hypothetical protein KJ698_12790 [Actinobacteria bacterium]|nr:hypothetical protein [Actinomycetota bacterium]MBU1494645.1 hypothetical protein [Actinomycetota bacterium]MBU1866042.1 hypothetical protein [Actinomycetota bacterium]
MDGGLVRVPVGAHRFQAQVITEACRAAGIRVELLTADDSGVDPVIGIIQGFHLLVRDEDVDQARAIVGRGWATSDR